MASPRISIRVGIVRGIDFGRIQVRTGTTDPEEHEQLHEFFWRRMTAGDVDFLTAVRDHGTRALRQFYDEAMSGKRSELPLDRPEGLSDALLSWVNGLPRDKHRRPLKRRTVRTYKEAVKALITIGGKGATVHAIPDVLAAYLEHCEKHGKNFPYRHARSALACFARNTGNERLSAQIKKSPCMHNDRKRDRVTIEPKEVRRIMKRIDAAGFSFLSQHLWNLACLAMRPSEYCQENPQTPTELVWRDDSVQIKGGKTRSARRFIPRLPGVRPAQNVLCLATGRIGRVSPGKEGQQPYYALNTLRKQFTLACGGKYQLYDLRASGMKWQEWAGLSERQIQAFAGHRPSVSRGYRTNGNDYRDWQRDIGVARKKMRAWFETEGVLRRSPKNELEELKKQKEALEQRIQKLSA